MIMQSAAKLSNRDKNGCLFEKAPFLMMTKYTPDQAHFQKDNTIT
jgi:hypothetical protein